MKHPPRVVSLLPAATEIVAALGLADQLVGISHECEFPAEISGKPHVTRSRLHQTALSSAEIDREVQSAMAAGETLYSLDEALLRELQPDVILTQQLCDVCAIGFGSVAALAATLPGSPQLVNLEPQTLDEIFTGIQTVAEVLQAPERGIDLVSRLRLRVDAIRRLTEDVTNRPRTFLMEWIDPPFCAGHWNPELVALAGGQELIGTAGKPSRRVTWDEIRSAQPEVLPIVCCGYSVERAAQDLEIAKQVPGWEELPAVRNGRVYLADGTAYFTVPGPRIVDSLEILARMLHPELFPVEAEGGPGWMRCR